MAPIKNRKPFLIAVIIFLILLSGCLASRISEEKDNQAIPADMSNVNKEDDIPFATPEVIKMHEANLAKEYFIGPGDKLKIEIWERPELTGEHLVGPYGNITLPLIGEFHIGQLTRKDAADAVQKAFSRLYKDPIVTLTILEYMNNKVYVLGRVSNPGIIHLDGHATILEALSMAGGLPTIDKSAFLSKCYIIRGKDQIIWINLLQLLGKANMKLNIGLANNDIIYIPDSTDASVFVMGEVESPGSYAIQTSGMSFLDAVNQAGGPTEDADIRRIQLVRNMHEQDKPITIDLSRIISKGDFSQNLLLKDNDIIYIPRKGVAEFNYYLRQISPFLNTFITGNVLQEAISN